jgi:dephospho-CoA kinase
MTVEKFESILSKQVPDALKRRSADFVVQTGLGRIASLRKIRHIAHIAPFLKPNKWP